MKKNRDQKILVLGYHDHTAGGHTLSLYKQLKNDGYDVRHISYIAGYSNDLEDKDIRYYCKFTNKWDIRYFISRLKRRVITLLMGNTSVIKSEYCYYNRAGCFDVNARSIIRKAGFVPDVIFLGWIDFFISPKTIWGLYQITNAKIVICMVDAHVLGGGCHFPCECIQYKTGCQACPAISNKNIASSLYQEKLKYLSSIPFLLVGTNYDLNRAKEVPFLKNKEYVSVINTPEIPFSLKKSEAREKIGISQNKFVIFCGAASVKDKRKGFHYVMDAIRIFCNNYSSNVVLVVAGKGEFCESLDETRVSVVTPGYVSLELLFTYYYASDIFVSASLDDSGPIMVNYSIACGIPVVSFPTGAALDIVIPKKTGYLANLGDANSLAEGISSFYNMSSKERDVYSSNCLSLMKSLRNDGKSWYMKWLESEDGN